MSPWVENHVSLVGVTFNFPPHTPQDDLNDLKHMLCGILLNHIYIHYGFLYFYQMQIVNRILGELTYDTLKASALYFNEAKLVKYDRIHP